jgi:hypothetical protein
MRGLKLGLNFQAGTGEGEAPSVPANAIRDRAGNPILDRASGYIVTR